MRIAVLMLACWWTLVSADLQLYHQRYHLLVPPNDTDRTSTLFGYSVAFQQLDTGTQRVVVGAPLADDVGRVYACSLTAAAAAASDPTICGQIKVDAFQVTRVHKYQDEEDHSWKSLNHTHNMWLGATITVTGGDFITCAPRWSQSSKDEKDAYIVYGKCYKIHSSGRSTLMSTPTTELYCNVCRNKNLFMNGGLGWSAAGNKDMMILGAPATCTTGAFFSTYEADSVDARWTGESVFGYNYFPATTCSNHRVTLPTMNFGYAMVVGNFVSAKFGDVWAVSSLYGKQGHGEVLLIHGVTSTSIRLRDARVGSMFGASLCAVRAHAGVDHEDHDDLLVGAPLYTPDPQQLEQGAVFLYYGGTKLTSAKDVQPDVILYGESNKPRGYFGNAIAKIGDVDDDGNEEFAVGAPYEDDVRGAVYVFSLWFEKNEVRYSRQRLSPELKGFGQSIAVLRDIDRNGCNELAVGAFDTAAVAVLHCQPIITVQAETNILSLQLWKLPETAGQFPFMSCVRVQYPAGIEVTGRLTVKTTLSDLGGGATLQPADQQYTVPLNPTGDNPICRTIKVTTVPERLSNRMEFSMVVTAADDCFKGPYVRTCALLSQHSVLAVKEFVVTHRCPSGVCRPRLGLAMHALDVEIGIEGARFEIGSRDSVNVRLRVSNSEDGAYEWCMDVRVEGEVSSRLPGCEYNEMSREHICQIGKGITPLLKGTTRDYNLILYTEQLTSESKNVEIFAVIKNFCHESTGVEKNIAINFYVNPERVSIKGISMEPKQVIDKLNLKKDSDKNSTLNHIYKVENEGLTTWTDVRLEVSTDYLPYLLLETPITKDFTCEKVLSHAEKQKLIQCYFKKIPPTSFIQITVPLVIIHNKVEQGLDNPVNITTTAKLKHRLFETSDRKVAQGTTLVSSVENANVLKWWHILLACLAALLVLAVIAFVLHKYGFFKRQTKKNLQELKRRSTMRQSQRMSRVGPPPGNSGAPATSTTTN